MSSAPAAAAAPSATATATVHNGTPNGTHTNGSTHNRPAKRPNNANRSGGNRKPKQQRTKRERNITEGSTEEVLRCDIDALLKARREAADGEPEDAASTATPEADLPEPFTEIEVEIHELSSTGDGLGMVAGSGSEQVYVVPFTVPGDTARIKVIRHVRGEGHSHADFVSVTMPSPLRDDARVRCRYFARCGGCQFQMLDYAEQLRRKRRIVVKAYDNFANLPRALVPEVRDTIGSPLQYGYRTKLTPHFDGPPGFRPAKRGKSEAASFSACPDIGFMQKGRRKVMDIEDCPIATEAVRVGNTRERKRMQDEYTNYKRGATLLLRENTTRHPKDSEAAKAELAPYTVKSESGDFVDVKSCETDSKATTTEYIDDYIFTNPAGSFFQNTAPAPAADRTPTRPIKYLIDAYSGSGLFTITLSSLFQRSIGIDIAGASIEYARRNAALNGLAEDRCRFIAADAGELFRSVAAYDPDETVVVLDPPRKGCDASFLAQLRKFGPRRVLYVSCNVHTQARDVGVLVRGEGEGRRYEIESLVGFDFFPQTGHVEGVAILNRVEEEGEATQN
ncbi:tRNA (uracil-5-)-methyltransferase [Cordyceps fumosorosea ARSEF 2679]|uniref:tRNA (Uracil-5-)-methyltransferase n=1 Tax=Cordyceps fumosorosea (strain ARSEF 2679) TaxID=1081104 RepID=A0A167M6Y1_CORFA|nr:tRNA (uracil-5-)-methyltransferase [Cordyceps fumosorosea ARSEF 2679]OAA54014.1 tRNA (uracil-5-)-methyltransferase [Cordyceps fumosorosea ARSEF 2679]